MKNLYEKIKNKEEKIAIIGLGYVGMPLAVSFAREMEVVGFDLNKEKVEKYLNGIDPTKEVGDEIIKNTTVKFTWDEKELQNCKFHIVAVPTPINDDKTPNLRPVEGASELVGRNLTKGSIVVYESTVFPGVTEEICIPILEKESGLKCGDDFFVGYSPERINPGDKVHRLETIIKIVSGQNEEILDIVAKVYELIIEAGVYRAESIKVAEAAKVIENSQRDVNIAFMNELSMVFNRIGIDTKAVLDAAGSKWNFMKFEPGLVGGHCIGVDPYYLTYKGEQLGYHSQIILSGRRINDDMGKYVVENTIKNMIKLNKKISGAKVGILGFTFKENCPDIRNTKIIDIVNELKEYGIAPIISDYLAVNEEVVEEYGIELSEQSRLNMLDALIIAVPHSEYKKFDFNYIKSMFKNNESGLIIDIKGIMDREICKNANIMCWRL
ncbi:nucleotide sugar dehydrogenase [uncultured Clostridium sp.]|jgi:UDP-N-acetyl-D-galactosamine dehydrogenase|uniref:nucleotide sugar dehydrogenase n=1 Tax=uncultured Clostridium sp. TaxID=59620 RepID=UPI002638AC86|nr:nucleotide sugar dehydrogenase [uncultured Clostridium sp.]